MQQTTQHNAAADNSATAAGVAGLVGVRAAAAALELAPSTVTRYLKDHDDLVRQTSPGGRPLVDLDELRDNRAGNVNPAMSGNHEGGEPPHMTSGAKPSALAAAKARQATILAERAAIELARVQGELLERADYEDAALKAGLMFRQALASQRRGLAEECAALGDQAKIIEHLEAAAWRPFGQLAAARGPRAKKSAPRLRGALRNLLKSLTAPARIIV